MNEYFSYEDGAAYKDEAVEPGSMKPKKPGRKAVLLGAALALFGGEEAFADVASETASQTRTALAAPGKTTTTKPRRKNISVAYSAGPTFSLFSSGDNAVESPGVVVRTDAKGVLKPTTSIGVEIAYSPIAARVSKRGSQFIARDNDERLDGGMVALKASVTGDFPMVNGGAFDASFRVGSKFGVAALYTEGEIDVGIARKSDEEGRREFANMPSQVSVFPISSLSAGVVVETRDGITGAIEGTVTLGGFPSQINPGDPDKFRSVFYDVSVGAIVGYKFR